jgi:hypothetical protein
MQANFELEAVRRFATELDARRAGCNGEGTFCSDLDEALGCHAAVCEELRHEVNRWASEVFAGRVAFDPEVEAIFKAELGRALNDARPLAKYGRAVATECYSLDRLDALESCVADFDALLANWVSPQRSVAPAPRTVPGETADKQIRQRVQDLPPLPADWKPKDSRQARIFGRRATS